MRPVPAITLTALLLAPASAGAQDFERAHLTFEVAAPGFRGGITDTSTPPIHVRPYTPRMYTVRYTNGWFGFGLEVGMARSELKQNDLALVAPIRIAISGFAPEYRFPLWRNEAGIALIGHLGPTLTVWSTDGYGNVARIGGLAGATLLIPLAGRLSAAVRGDLGVSDAHIPDLLLDPDLSSHALWRTRFGLGLSYQLTSDD